MRQTDQTEVQTLGKKIEAPPPPAPEKKERWAPITSQPGYERNEVGSVRKKS